MLRFIRLKTAEWQISYLGFLLYNILKVNQMQYRGAT